MQQKKIAIIGGGNMGQAIACGLVTNGIKPENIYVTNRTLEKIKYLQNKFKINIETDNCFAAEFADIIILAVKPKMLSNVCEELSEIIETKKPLVISVAAGVNLKQLNNWLPVTVKIIRAMPNTPAAAQAGVTAIYANEKVNDREKEITESIFRAVGIVVWLKKEDEIDILTALSGSGPAYLFLIMEAMENSAVKLGLTKEQAKLITSQVVLGAAKIALEDKHEFSELREAVTSPKGTTAAALAIFEKQNLRGIIFEAMQAALIRSKELAKEVNKE